MLIEILKFFSAFMAGFTVGIILWERKFTRPYERFFKEAVEGWSSALELTGRVLKEKNQLLAEFNKLRGQMEDLPTKSPIQIL